MAQTTVADFGRRLSEFLNYSGPAGGDPPELGRLGRKPLDILNHLFMAKQASSTGIKLLAACRHRRLIFYRPANSSRAPGAPRARQVPG